MLENQIIDAPERNELPVLGQVSPYPTVKKYGLIIFLVGVVQTMLMISLGMMSNTWISWLASIPTLVIFYFAFREHKANDLQDYLPFSRVVRISWLIGLLIAIPFALFSYILYQYIAPNALEQVLEMTRERMELQPNMDPEMVDGILKAYTKWFFNPSAMAIFMLIGSPIMYLLYGMLVGAFMHKPIPRFR